MGPRVQWSVVLLAVVLLLHYATGCTKEGNGTDPQDMELVTVEEGSLTVSVTAIGKISAGTDATLSFGTPGQINAVVVKSGQRVKAGQTLASLDTWDLELQVQSTTAALQVVQAQLDQVQNGPRPEQVAIAQANLEAAEARLNGAQARLRELENGPDAHQIAATQANLEAAEAGVWAAVIQRKQTIDGALPSEVAAAEAQLAQSLAQQKIARDTHDRTLSCQVIHLPDGTEENICPALGTMEEQARYQLYAADEAVAAAQARLDQLADGPTGSQVDAAEANLALAIAQRDAVQAQLDMLAAGTRAEQIAAAEAEVEALAAQRDAAQAQLDLSMAGATVAEITVAKANLLQAQTALERARLALEKAVLKAPFDGIVTRLHVAPGEYTTPQMPVLTLVDDSRFGIEAKVDETDIGWVETGQEVRLTLDAFPSRALEGRVATIDATASPDMGIVSYKVVIEIEPTDLTLRDGMTANAEIITRERAQVLLVPNRAIWIDSDSGRAFVEKMVDDHIVHVTIQQGLTNDQFSEVLEGLEEGDQLVVRSESMRDRFRDIVTGSMSSD